MLRRLMMIAGLLLLGSSAALAGPFYMSDVDDLTQTSAGVDFRF
jgi:hypothetical protein